MNIGAFGENFPYTNFHDLNLDWIIKTLKDVNDKLDDALRNNSIKLADPFEWNITTQYEPLTIVEDNNTLYISKQAVPSGINITDEDYWIKLFNIQPILDEQAQFEQEITDRQNQFEQGITDSQTQFEQKITDSQTQFEQEIENNTVKSNKAKHILWVGDSYTAYYSGRLFNEFVALSGVPRSQCHNVAVSGAGFSIAQTKTFQQEIEDYTGDRNEITDIIVCGGINDARIEFHTEGVTTPDISIVTTPMHQFKNYALTYYPNAKLHIAYVGGTLPTSQYYATLHPYDCQEWALWAYTVYAQSDGWNILNAKNAIHSSVLNYHNDKLHPSELGVTAIASAVASAFNNDVVPYNRPVRIIQATAYGKNSRDFPMFAYIENDILTLSTPDTFIQIKQGQTINASDWSPILQIPEYLIREPHYMNCIVSLRGFSEISNIVAAPATLQIRDGIVSIKIANISGTTYTTLTAKSNAFITFFALQDIVCPLWQAN